MGNEQKKTKVPTEELKMDDIWNNFKSDYLPFVEWRTDADTEETFVIVEFLDDAPVPYTNKWSREQFKMRVNQDNEERMLSAGKKLFIALKKYCMSAVLLPSQLGNVAVVRIGSGFDTEYKIQQPITKKK
jgi:hypothetical protein